MFKSNSPLLHPAEFDNALFFGTNVMVVERGGSEIIDYGGPIEKHSENAVYINGGYFLKQNFDFKIR